MVPVVVHLDNSFLFQRTRGDGGLNCLHLRRLEGAYRIGEPTTAPRPNTIVDHSRQGWMYIPAKQRFVRHQGLLDFALPALQAAPTSLSWMVRKSLSS